jgi:hypothetical protein
VNSSFLASLVASVVANVLTLPIAWFWLKEWHSRRRIGWLWGGKRPVVVTSTITGVDDHVRYRSKSVFTHIGDAQAAALAQLLLRSTRKELVDLSPQVPSFQQNVDYVNIGGPAFNSATRRLFESIRNSWSLPFEFCKEENKWLLRGSGQSFALGLSDKREVIGDVGLIAKLPHPGAIDSTDQGAFTIILAGLSTYGTLGASRFAADAGCIQLLRKRLKLCRSRDRRYFCAVVQVTPQSDLLGIEAQSLELCDVLPVTRRGR